MKHLLLSAALATALVTSTQAQEAHTVLATVNGVEITLGHIIALRARLPEQYQQLPDDVLFNGLVDQVIQQELLAADARKNLDYAQSLALENEARALLAGDMIERVSNQEVSDADLQAAYEAEFADTAPEPEFNAAHILVETEEEAQTLITELANGVEFADLARAKSTGPSGPNGGALGWFGLGQMVPPFEQAVVALEVGAVSEPVQTQFGWHVIQLNEKRLRGAPALEDIRAQLDQALRAARVDDRVAELEAAADITRAEVDLDPSVIRQLELLAE